MKVLPSIFDHGGMRKIHYYSGIAIHFVHFVQRTLLSREPTFNGQFH